MLLSDRDLLAEIDAGSLGLDPFDASLIQPSSIDVRLDRYFRVFNNSRTRTSTRRSSRTT